jgi:hypothetical protein
VASLPQKQVREQLVQSGHAYWAGRTAYRDGMTAEENPHPRNRGLSRSRMFWFYGWFDARTSERLKGA